MRYVVEVEREEEGGWLAEVSGDARAVAFERRGRKRCAPRGAGLAHARGQLEHRELPRKLDITFVAA